MVKELSAVQRPVVSVPGDRPPPSALYWVFAVVGAISLAVGIQAWVRWIGSADFMSTPSGPDPFRGWQVVGLRAIEVAVFAGGLIVVVRYVLVPLACRRPLTFDGKFVLGSTMMWWIDPILYNYFNFSLQYNTHLLNFGSWTRSIPGWQAPNSNSFPEPILCISGFYMWLFFIGAVLGCHVLRKLRQARPDVTVLGMLFVLLALFTVLDFLLEFTLVRGFQMFTFGGTERSLTLFAGRWYQFPVYNSIGVGLAMTGMTALRFFRDDRGLSLAERGVDRLTGRTRRIVSVLAVTGWVHLTFLVGYVPLYQFFTLKADTFPALPSYFRAGICGDGTDYACPSQEFIPIPSRTSLHVGPTDPRLPASVRDRQGVSR